MTYVDNLKSNIDCVNVIWTQWKKNKILEKQRSLHIYAKIDGNHHLTNKYYLLTSMKRFFKDRGQNYTEIMPMTFKVDYVESSLSHNRAYQKFLKVYR